ncbi:MAG: hypothetical protein R3254_07450 [Thiomicrorhabdus sp.]|nr:hypothetical protein [Thiomicrorhabdus sp.]
MIEEDFEQLQNDADKPKPLDPKDYANLSPVDFNQQRQIDWLLYETHALRNYSKNLSNKHKEFRKEIKDVYVRAVWLVVGIIAWTWLEPSIKSLFAG